MLWPTGLLTIWIGSDKTLASIKTFSNRAKIMIKEFIDMPRLERWVGRTFSFLAPNTWTTISLVIAVFAFCMIANGQIAAGLFFFLLASLCDLIDGKVARFSNRASALGAFWDGIVDRFVDALMIASFFFLPFNQSRLHIDLLLFSLLFATLLPPFIVAYANHRGAVPDPTEKVIWRIAFRSEYLLLFLLVIALFPFTPMVSYYLLWASLILMVSTVVQSLVLVFIRSKDYR